LAILLASTIVLIAARVQAAATVRLTEEVNAHWRGAYDILVRPRNAHLNLESTSGLVEPNFVSLAGQGGISSSQVSAIRAIPGVEIAAPIAWVGLATTATTAPSIEITHFPSKPTLYSATVTISTSDSVTTHLIYEDRVAVLIAPRGGANGGPLVVSDSGDTVLGPAPGGGWVADVSLGQVVPQVQSPIVAVDPDAERALLGDDGAFLDPLAKITNRDALTVGSFNPRVVLPGYDAGSDIAIMQSHGGASLGRPVFPTLASQRTYAPYVVSIDVTQTGHALDQLPEGGQSDAATLAQARTAAGSGSTPFGTNATDWQSSLRPFRTNAIGVPWPGSQFAEDALPVEVHSPTQVKATLAGRPGYTGIERPDGSPLPAYRVAPLGEVGPGGPGSDSASVSRGGTHPPVTVGVEQAYRTLQDEPVPVASGFQPRGPLDTPFVLAPIGEYDLNSLRLPHDPLDYVPYGVYDPPDTSLIADAAGNPRSGSLTPTLNPAGFLTVPPMGIVDIHAAELLRGPAPIDAVRIRVAGITAYGGESIAKVGRVAQQIESLGLDVDVVAASSPQSVRLYVPDYRVTSEGAVDLGWVEQNWTTLGAATRVERSLSETSGALIVIAVLGLAVMVGAAEVMTSASRAREAAILAAVGWRRGSIVRWQASESVVAALIVYAVGLSAWILSAREQVALVIVLLGGTFFAGSGVVGALIVQNRSAAGSGSRTPFVHLSPQVSNVRRYAWRSIIARPWRAGIVIAGAALSGGLLAPALALLVVLGARVGPTHLGTALLDRLEPYQLGLLVIVSVTGLSCVFLVLRSDYRSRTAEFRILEACGWGPRLIRRCLTWARVFLAIPGAALAGLVSAFLAHPVAGSDVSIVVIALIGALAGGGMTIGSGLLAQLRSAQ
jgi:hypothetical protein